MALPELKLSLWKRGKNAQTLKRLATAWWEQVYQWLTTPLSFSDAITAPLEIVDLLAYQRNVNRYSKEPDWLYRLRTHHALINAKDAGTGAGMARIFERLEMPIFGIDERIEGYDWDMLRLRANMLNYNDHRIALGIVLKEYRRTCRRWVVEVESEPLESHELITLGGAMVIEPNTNSFPMQSQERVTMAGIMIIDFGGEAWA